MQIDNDFYKLFLEELNNLDKFRMSYASTHSTDLLGRDDPDVKRLLEAIAFFQQELSILLCVIYIQHSEDFLSNISLFYLILSLLWECSNVKWGEILQIQ